MKKLKLQLPSPRLVSFVAFFLCIFLLGAAAYLQYNLNLAPCPLCIIQRIIIVLLGLVFLIYPLHKPRRLGRQIYNGLTLVVAVLGIAVAGRHVWIEYLPSNQLAPCGASLNELLANLPFQEAIAIVLRGSGDCAKITWQLWHLSLPAWTLIFFVVFAFISLWQILRRE